MWPPSLTTCAPPKQGPTSKEGQQQCQHWWPQPPAPPITLLRLVWWPKHNLQLKHWEMRQGRARNSIYVGAHLTRHQGKDRCKQTPLLIMHLCLLLCCQSAPWKLRAGNHNLPKLPARQQQPFHFSIMMQIISLTLECLFTSMHHRSRVTIPLPQLLTSWEKTRGCPCWVLLLVEGDAGHGQRCAKL